MKEIETLVEEKKKDSSEMAMVIGPQEGKHFTKITSELVHTGESQSLSR